MDTNDNLRKEAKRWLRSLRAGDPEAYSRLRQAYPSAPATPVLRDVQHALAREMGHQDWAELRRGLDRTSRPPDITRLESLAADILLAYQTGDAAALGRLSEVFHESATWEGHRALVARVLNRIGGPGWAEPLTLDRARLFIALEAGLESWEALARLIEANDAGSQASLEGGTSAAWSPDEMQPVEMRTTFPMEMQDGLYSTTTEVWKMLSATRSGDLAAVKTMVEANPALVRCEHNYVPPLQLAVREGHTELVEYLLGHGAYDPRFVTYPYRETIHVLASDRKFLEIARLLEQYRSSGRPRGRGIHGPGHIDLSGDPANADRVRLERLIDADALHAVEKLATSRPDLLHDPLLFWAEGVLSSPCHGRRLKMIDLLVRLGARVPGIAKWAPYYYFRHLDIAEKLLSSGMNPNHMNWHRTTLLHHMAWEGDVPKTKLLLSYGANINLVDDEFRSTPLGLAAKAGRVEIVKLLLERGADPNEAGAPWATPLAWARRKENTEIQAELRSAGAG